MAATRIIPLHSNKGKSIAYQVRQSFKPGEVTPEEANQIGYELAMHLTKGKHAFLVATHTDRAHIHNHIIWNSTTIDGSRKFRNGFLSYLTVQKVSDRLCVQHGLSIIDEKPYRERQKRSIYPAKPSARDTICAAIDEALKKHPDNLDALLELLRQEGYEIKRGKHIALKGKEQKRYIRMRSLGEGYSEEELVAVLAGSRKHTPGRRKNKERSFWTQPKRLGLLIDIEAKLNEGKGAGYARWAKVYNLKQMAEAVCFIKEHNVETFEELSEKADAAAARFSALSDSIKASEQRLAEINALRKHILNYSKTRDVYTAYRKSRYSETFLEEHRSEITLHQAAKAAFDELGVQKLPRVKELNAEFAQVLAQKKKTYTEYRTARKEMQDLAVARKTVESILGREEKKTEKRKTQEQVYEDR